MAGKSKRWIKPEGNTASRGAPAKVVPEAKVEEPPNGPASGAGYGPKLRYTAKQARAAMYGEK